MKLPKLSAHAFRSLLRTLGQKEVLQGGALGPELRERIILHVSAVNRCAVCSSVHEKSALDRGLDQAQVAAALARDLEGLDERTRLALRYAELRTLDREKETDAEVKAAIAAFEERFSAEEQAEVRAVVDLFTFNNRFNNTWEGLLPGAAARRRRFGSEG